MSTSVQQSAVISQNIETVWKSLRDFTFPSKIFPQITSATIEEGNCSTSVGSVRKLTWASGEVVKQRLLELSDLEHKVVYELIDSEQITEVTAYITTIKLIRITENDTTLVLWSGDFSSDVKKEFITHELRAYSLNLKDLQKHFNKN